MRLQKRTLNLCFLCLVGMCLVQTISLNQRTIKEAIAQDVDHPNDAPVAAESSLPENLQPYTRTLQQSDFVELEHCKLHAINWTEFQSWADSIVESSLSKRVIAEVNHTSVTVSELKDEWTMELLELYAMHSGLCQFEDYQPRIRSTASIKEAGWKLQRVVKKVPLPPKQSRIVFSIVAYKDSAHLRRLIEAIHLPQHLIIIHLEQGADVSFIRQVEEISTDYSNVVNVQFGTIIYKTDSISRVTLILMHWVVNKLKLEFDYFASLGGAVYPLFGALELSQHLYASQGNVWLGEAMLKGSRVQQSQSHLLWKQRLIGTSTKIAVRTGKLFQDPVPDWMDQALQHKSNSGNQAMFSFSTIARMLESPKVLNIFALAKYSCCCCVEERSWIAAMDLIGLLQEARENSNMFQLWGGAEDQCIGSMNNAILDLNKTRCFRNESPNQEDVYFWGNETWNHLLTAKRRGLMFARKFSSSHRGSMELLARIKTEVHGSASVSIVTIE